VGGAMDLMSGARRVIIVMIHNAKDGTAKLVRECSLPLTSLRPVDWVVTELATFQVDEDGLSLVETAPGVSAETVRARTAARFREGALLGKDR
jgi:3-oxoacid CoA-transferase B subunit